MIRLNKKEGPSHDWIQVTGYNQFHRDYSSRRGLNLSDKLFLTQTMSHERAFDYYNQGCCQEEDLARVFKEVKYLGNAEDVLNYESYRLHVFITHKNHLILWSDDGNSWGSPFAVGGHIVCLQSRDLDVGLIQE